MCNDDCKIPRCSCCILELALSFQMGSVGPAQMDCGRRATMQGLLETSAPRFRKEEGRSLLSRLTAYYRIRKILLISSDMLEMLDIGER